MIIPDCKMDMDKRGNRSQMRKNWPGPAPFRVIVQSSGGQSLLSNSLLAVITQEQNMLWPDSFTQNYQHSVLSAVIIKKKQIDNRQIAY